MKDAALTRDLDRLSKTVAIYEDLLSVIRRSSSTLGAPGFVKAIDDARMRVADLSKDNPTRLQPTRAPNSRSIRAQKPAPYVARLPQVLVDDAYDVCDWLPNLDPETCE